MNTITSRQTIVAIAAKLMKSQRRMFAEYEEASAQYAKEGFRNQYCVHGVNLWHNDFDGACGACEEGDSFFEYSRQAEICLGTARRACEERDSRMSMLLDSGLVGKVPSDLRDELVKWVWEPVNRIS